MDNFFIFYSALIASDLLNFIKFDKTLCGTSTQTWRGVAATSTAVQTTQVLVRFVSFELCPVKSGH